MNDKKKTQPLAGHRPKRLLVVDDEAGVREMVGRVLAGEGYEVLTAADGAEALRLAAGMAIDLVLLDLNMPGQGGWDVFAELTSKDPLLAVIIITAKPNQLFMSMGAGVGALLEKPLDFPHLLQTVAALLAESAAQRLARASGRQTDFHYRPSVHSDRHK